MDMAIFKLPLEMNKKIKKLTLFLMVASAPRYKSIQVVFMLFQAATCSAVLPT